MLRPMLEMWGGNCLSPPHLLVLSVFAVSLDRSPSYCPKVTWLGIAKRPSIIPLASPQYTHQSLQKIRLASPDHSHEGLHPVLEADAASVNCCLAKKSSQNQRNGRLVATEKGLHEKFSGKWFYWHKCVLWGVRETNSESMSADDYNIECSTRKEALGGDPLPIPPPSSPRFFLSPLLSLFYFSFIV